MLKSAVTTVTNVIRYTSIPLVASIYVYLFNMDYVKLDIT